MLLVLLGLARTVSNWAKLNQATTPRPNNNRFKSPSTIQSSCDNCKEVGIECKRPFYAFSWRSLALIEPQLSRQVGPNPINRTTIQQLNKGLFKIPSTIKSSCDNCKKVPIERKGPIYAFSWRSLALREPQLWHQFRPNGYLLKVKQNMNSEEQRMHRQYNKLKGWSRPCT